MSPVMSKLEIGDYIVCIKEFESLKVGEFYKIKGTGYGYGGNNNDYRLLIEDEKYGEKSGKKDWWNLPYELKVKWYYLNEDEINKHFIKSDDYYKSWQRNNIINEIIGDE